MSDFSDIDGGEEPLFAEYEDEDLADPPPLPPPLAILSAGERDPGSLDDIGVGDDGGFSQPFDTSRNESHDQSSSAASAAKKRKPILTFNEGRLTSPKGLQAIVTDFPKVKFKGKGHEKSDLKLLINNYEEWANRLFPRLAFDDFIERAEKLGAKKEVKALVNQLRNGTSRIDDDELMLRDEVQEPTVHHNSNTGVTDADQGESDLPDNNLMLDDADHHGDNNHHGDDDLMLDNANDHDNDHHGDDDEVAVSANAVNTLLMTEEEAMVDEGTVSSEPPVNAVMRSPSGNSVQGDDQLSDDESGQVKITGDHNPSLIVDSDGFDHDSLIHHNNGTSDDHKDVPNIHRDTPTEHESHDNIDIDDTPTDIMDHVIEEPFHNSVDKLFNDISVDELFDDA